MSMLDALLRLRPEGRFSVCDDDYDTIVSYSEDVTIPTREELEAEMLVVQAEKDSVAYRDARNFAYPSIGDQLDALFHAGVFPEEMAAKIQAVKDAYPKPE